MYQAAADKKEWSRLIETQVWSYDKIREWNEVASTARRTKQDVHLGRLFGIMVEKGSELLENDPLRKYKYRVVFQGNRVIDQDWQAAIFQDLGSSPAGMEASKATDAYGCFAGHDIEQADATQAYVQAYLEGKETWVELPQEAIDNDPAHRHLFYTESGEPKFTRPCVRLVRALYGHPAGSSISA